MQFVYVQLLFSQAFGLTCSQEMSHRVGAQANQNIDRIGQYGLATTLLWLTPPSIIIAAYPALLQAPSHLSSLIAKLAPTMAVTTIIDAARNNFLEELRACDDAHFPSALSVAGAILTAILATALGLNTSWNIMGVAIGLLLGLSIASTALGIRWHQTLKAKACLFASDTEPLLPDHPETNDLINTSRI
jgi:Na+-driven multidrug efflux pump